VAERKALMLALAGWTVTHRTLPEQPMDVGAIRLVSNLIDNAR
jgi:hypothetical protein